MTQLPEHLYKDDATHDDRRRRRCLNATLLSHNNFRIAQKDPCNHLTFREFFDEMTVKRDSRTQGFETVFARSSSDHRVSATVIVASRLSGADEHHTASSHAILNPAFSRSSFHARAIHSDEPVVISEEQ